MGASISFRLIVITVLVLVCTTIEAMADKRVALVVGNSAYQNVPQLPNPSARPGHEMSGGREAAHVAANLGQDCRRRPGR